MNILGNEFSISEIFSSLLDQWPLIVGVIVLIVMYSLSQKLVKTGRILIKYVIPMLVFMIILSSLAYDLGIFDSAIAKLRELTNLSPFDFKGYWDETTYFVRSLLIAAMIFVLLILFKLNKKIPKWLFKFTFMFSLGFFMLDMIGVDVGWFGWISDVIVLISGLMMGG